MLLHSGSGVRFRMMIAGNLLIQELRQRHRQGIGNSRHHHQAGVPLPPFNATHIGQVNLRLERKLLLGQLPLLTEAPATRAPPQLYWFLKPIFRKMALPHPQ
jgi:hypothetical protein